MLDYHHTHPNPIDTEFWRLCELGIIGINVIKIWTKNNKLCLNLICKLILQKWIINFISLRYLKTKNGRELMYVHVYKMCAKKRLIKDKRK